MAELSKPSSKKTTLGGNSGLSVHTGILDIKGFGSCSLCGADLKVEAPVDVLLQASSAGAAVSERERPEKLLLLTRDL